MSDRVIVSVENGVAHVRLNRPDKRNGLDKAMFEALIAAGERLIGEPGLRAVVLSGEGKAFCAGLDWQAFLAMGGDAAKWLLARPSGPANVAQRVSVIWQEVPVPVIAAIQGAVFGGGLQIALGADLRYAAPDTQLSVMEVRYGLVPDMGITQSLPRLVRDDVARELVFTGRTVEAGEALALGLVTRICEDPLAAAMETARTIASKSPQAVRAGKRLLNEGPRLDRAGALLLETELQLTLLGTANQLEAVMASMGKREARFVD